VVRFLCGAGIRQFLDIGSGLPASPNVHEVAQACAPDARVVYVDNDPMAFLHAEAPIATDSITSAVRGGLRGHERVLRGAAELLDFGKPVALLFLGTCTTSRTMTTLPPRSPATFRRSRLEVNS
jgi:hypothetical protein